MSIIEQLPLILGLDIGGRPVQWLPWQEAVCLHVRGDIAWTCGTQRILVRGGMNQASGMRSVVDISSIVAIRNARALYAENVPPTLNNQALFRRDRFCCLFCGEVYCASLLTRDHVVPRSRGGADVWTNVVTACRPCNQKKADKTPEEARMPLLALPYVPSRIEALLLRKRILVDQMDFLLQHIPKARRMLYTSLSLVNKVNEQVMLRSSIQAAARRHKITLLRGRCRLFDVEQLWVIESRLYQLCAQPA